MRERAFEPPRSRRAKDYGWNDHALDLDRPIRGVQSGKSARAVKNLSQAEDHFADHFPG